MNLKKILITFPLVCIGLSFIQKKGLEEIIKPGDKLEKLADGFLFTEGPTSDAKGNVYFTDQPNNRIMEWSVSDELSTFMQPCGRSNGMSFDNKGNLWSCADEKMNYGALLLIKMSELCPPNIMTNLLMARMTYGLLIMVEFILPIRIINVPGGIIIQCHRIARLFTILNLTTKRSQG
jgi:hypothetical protein